jgi:signal transduction histidine kinase
MRRRLLPEIETTIYRIVLEALTNVILHAAATSASLILEYHADTVVTIIEHNGRGFDTELQTAGLDQELHLGLLGMQKRAALVKGAITIESSIGLGTTAIVRIPLVEEAISCNHSAYFWLMTIAWFARGSRR